MTISGRIMLELGKIKVSKSVRKSSACFVLAVATLDFIMWWSIVYIFYIVWGFLISGS